MLCSREAPVSDSSALVSPSSHCASGGAVAQAVPDPARTPVDENHRHEHRRCEHGGNGWRSKTSRKQPQVSHRVEPASTHLNRQRCIRGCCSLWLDLFRLPAHVVNVWALATAASRANTVRSLRLAPLASEGGIGQNVPETHGQVANRRPGGCHFLRRRSRRGVTRPSTARGANGLRPEPVPTRPQPHPPSSDEPRVVSGVGPTPPPPLAPPS